jgi:hypothetical protein
VVTELLEPLEVWESVCACLEELAQSDDSVSVLVEQAEHLLDNHLGLCRVGVIRGGSSLGRVVVESI